MSWTTIYITGNTDFREEIRRSLDHSNLDIMPGYIQPVENMLVHDLYWIGENVNIRELKKAIGSKLIWKYRLRFFRSLEEFVEYKYHQDNSNLVTADDLSLDFDHQ
jgi:hypothetical protein